VKTQVYATRRTQLFLTASATTVTRVAAFLSSAADSDLQLSPAQVEGSIERIQFLRRYDSSIVCGSYDRRSDTLSGGIVDSSET
jgi:hypothetical protein